MKTINIKTSWEELTLGEANQIIQIVDSNISEDYKSSNIIAVLTGLEEEEVASLPLTTFLKLQARCKFIFEDPKKVNHKMQYEINGRKYNLKANISDITTAQYIDYQNIIKGENITPMELLAVFLVPDGKEYGSGYDIEQVKLDMEDMNFLDARSIGFFFERQLAVFILILKDSLLKTLKKEKVQKKKRKALETLFNNTASSLWFSKRAGRRILHLNL